MVSLARVIVLRMVVGGGGGGIYIYMNLQDETIRVVP